MSPVGLDIAASDAWGRTETRGEHEPRSGGRGVSPVGLDIAASDAWGRTETRGEHEPRSGGWGRAVQWQKKKILQIILYEFWKELKHGH